jgi:uncharacterized membrane protein
MTENPRSTASIGGHPLHVMLVPIPIACFVGTLITDIAYWRTLNLQWASFSAWLVSIGVVMAVVAALAGIIDFLGDRRIRSLGAAWVHGIGNALVLLLAIINAFVHSRDGYTSVVPSGLILSALTVLVLLVTGWNGWTMVHRYGVGVREERS